MSQIWDLMTLIFIIAVLYLLVKPSSVGPALIKEVTSSLSALINYSVRG